MCQECIDKLQETLDAEMVKAVLGNILIHFDSDPCGEVGTLLSREEVEASLHDSMNEHCWCRPYLIHPSDTRTAAEIWEAAGFDHEVVQ